MTYQIINMSKKILFLTGTRADFGKLKSLIRKVEDSIDFTANIFVTGMHMLSKYGMTVREVEKSGFKSIYKYINQNPYDSMDTVLAKTITGLSDYIKESRPDLIIVHGDRVEALAGAIVGSLNNILVGHIEGGEVSGAIDEVIRHAVTKLSHIHFVSNEAAKQRLIQLGERELSIFVIGSPDLDIMRSECLPNLNKVKEHYNIPFNDYAIFLFHPVTTELDSLSKKITIIIEALLEANENFIVIYPNNDMGSEIIINAYSKIINNPYFKIFPSIRFEYFLTLLKNTKYILGNSSAGVREAPFLGKTSINIGNRQNNRAKASSIINCQENKRAIITAINKITLEKKTQEQEFGNGNSNLLFFESLKQNHFWKTSKQKTFMDLT